MTEEEILEYAEKIKEEIAEAKKMFEEDTKIPALNFKLTENEPDIFTSKIGGTPYLPNNIEIPTDKHGKQMKLLAQFDCTLLSGMPDYPHVGMLQFWLSVNYPWREHKILYYKSIDRTVKEEDILSRITPFVQGETGAFPVINGGYGIDAKLTEESMGNSDKRCKAFLWYYLAELTYGKILDEYDDDISELIEVDCTVGHKLGGYSEDPQPIDRLSYDLDFTVDLGTDEEVLLLFQLEYDHGFGKNWSDNAKIIIGDCGVMHFFIKRKDLKALDFDKACFNWSCS